MRQYFTFNNGHSLSDFDVIVTEGPPYEILNEEYEEVKVEGRNGSLTIKKGTYPDRELPFELSILTNSSEKLFKKVDDIIDWLTNIYDNKLIYDRQDTFYVVKKVKINNVLNEIYAGGSFSVIFICEPFRYQVAEPTIVLTESTDLYYSGNAPGECNIKIYGSGNIQLTINSETVQINNVNEYVELDSKLISCLNKDKTSKSRDMIGHFLLLSRGKNNISWIGNVSKVEILMRTAFR